jgi:PII-like signaling protein
MNMLHPGPAKKVTVYVGEDVHRGGEPLYLAVLNYLFSHRVAGATVVKGVAGFGSDHRLHTSRLLEMSENLPLRMEFIESEQTLATILPALRELVTEGLIVVSDVEVIQHKHR